MNPRRATSLLTPLTAAPLRRPAGRRPLRTGCMPAWPKAVVAQPAVPLRALSMCSVAVQRGQVGTGLPLHLSVIFVRKPPPRA